MVLDDDEQLLALYRAVLVEAGYEVTLVKDGVEGLERLGEQPDGFLAKPFEIEALLEQLSTLTGHAG